MNYGRVSQTVTTEKSPTVTVTPDPVMTGLGDALGLSVSPFFSWLVVAFVLRVKVAMLPIVHERLLTLDWNQLGQGATYIAPAVVVVGGAWKLTHILMDAFEKKLNENRDVIMDRLNTMHSSQIAQDARLDGHDERLAWLEGNAGQPLHSIRSGRKLDGP